MFLLFVLSRLLHILSPTTRMMCVCRILIKITYLLTYLLHIQDNRTRCKIPPHISPYLITSNKLLNPHQSAYCKHSTETDFLYIHGHLINAIRSRKLPCLCLLDLSAAFDTIDHLLTHLSSWFGIHSSIHSWFKSYLLSRSFRVRCNNTFSSFYTSSSPRSDTRATVVKVAPGLILEGLRMKLAAY